MDNVWILPLESNNMRLILPMRFTKSWPDFLALPLQNDLRGPCSSLSCFFKYPPCIHHLMQEQPSIFNVKFNEKLDPRTDSPFWV